MKLQEASKREAMHIAVGTLVFSCIMNGVFALLGQWNLTVLWGTLLGGGFAVLNFILLALSVQKLAAETDEKKGKAWMQMSYQMRMIATVVVGIIGVSVPCFHWVAVLIPLLFPRITILAMQLLGMYKPEKLRKNEEGGDESV
ncbi:MAG: ATP synthase subunit I [Subdoligranulum sp.]|nr:ATP synthase subunit I [Subdoligranulum sp.]